MSTSDRVEKIKQFNELMTIFLGQISPLVGTSYCHYFENAIRMNALMPIKQFYLHVYPYKKKIINKDESYFKNTDNFKEKIKGDKMFQEIMRLKNIYDKLDEMNKEQMWMYFQALLVLSEEYNI